MESGLATPLKLDKYPKNKLYPHDQERKRLINLDWIKINNSKLSFKTYFLKSHLLKSHSQIGLIGLRLIILNFLLNKIYLY
jgi:hypothetical protein